MASSKTGRCQYEIARRKTRDDEEAGEQTLMAEMVVESRVRMVRSVGMVECSERHIRPQRLYDCPEGRSYALAMVSPGSTS